MTYFDIGQMLESAMWLITAGGVMVGLALAGHFLLGNASARGDLSKPLGIVGLGMLGVGTLWYFDLPAISSSPTIVSSLF